MKLYCWTAYCIVSSKVVRTSTINFKSVFFLIFTFRFLVETTFNFPWIQTINKAEKLDPHKNIHDQIYRCTYFLLKAKLLAMYQYNKILV